MMNITSFLAGIQNEQIRFEVSVGVPMLKAECLGLWFKMLAVFALRLEAIPLGLEAIASTAG